MIQLKNPLGRVAAYQIFWGQGLIEIASGASAWRVYHDLNKPQPMP